MKFSVTLQLSADTLNRLNERHKKTGQELDEIIFNGITNLMTESAEGEIRTIDPDHPGNLRHTFIKSGNIAGIPIQKLRWAGLLTTAHHAALKKLGNDKDALFDESTAYTSKEKQDPKTGYEFIEQFGFSIRKVEAVRSWEQTLQLCKKMQLSIDVKFEWRDKDVVDEKDRGVTGHLSWKPTNSSTSANEPALESRSTAAH